MTQIIHTTTVDVYPEGVDGSAEGTATSIPLSGELLDIYINWAASAPGTSDLTISETTMGTILAKADAVTDIRYAPRMVCHGADAAALTWYDRIPLDNSVITITVAQTDSPATLGVAYVLRATIRWVSYY